MTVAALFVERGGVYDGRPGVEAWTIEEDARLYRGPHPVVAHPPCQRWGRYWGGGPSARARRHLGDDEGCFAAALWAIRTFGGVIEHPEASHAFRWFGLGRPKPQHGWVDAGDGFGVVTQVDQGCYGHAARKRTWLYAVQRNTVDAIIPTPKQQPDDRDGRLRLEPGFHSKEEARAARAAPGWKPPKRLTKAEMIGTPPGFAALLIEIAEACR